MKPSFIAILLVSLFTGGLGTISRINEHTGIAASAYHRGEYIDAIASYEYLLDDLEVKNDQLRLNLGHAYFKVGELQKARQQYSLLVNHPSLRMRAAALIQLGNIAAREKAYKQALSYFRSALIAEPGNDTARYNYELLKKYMELRPDLAADEEDEFPAPAGQPQAEDQPDLQQQMPPSDEEEQASKPKKKPDSSGDEEEEVETKEQADDGQEEEQGAGNEHNQPGGGTGNRAENKDREEASGKEQGDTRGMSPDNSFDPARPERSRSNDPANDQEQRAQTRNNRLQQMNINPEKARLMLDAMRNAEHQYIQQLPKKATRKPDPSKPDW